jgi:hypothetical protein
MQLLKPWWMWSMDITLILGSNAVAQAMVDVEYGYTLILESNAALKPWWMQGMDIRLIPDSNGN